MKLSKCAQGGYKVEDEKFSVHFRSKKMATQFMRDREKNEKLYALDNSQK